MQMRVVANGTSSCLVIAAYEDGSIHIVNVSPSPTSTTTTMTLQMTCLARQRIYPDCIMALDVHLHESILSGLIGGPLPHLQRFALPLDTPIPPNNQPLPLVTHPSSPSSPPWQLPLPCPGVTVVAIRPDGRIALSASWDGSVRLYDWIYRRHVATLRHHVGSQVTCVAWLGGDVRILVTAAENGHVALWRLY